MTRLDAPEKAPSPLKLFDCLECSAPSSSPAANAEFCSTPCRKAWNNRRLTRGAELYDLMMVCRFDRGRAKALRIWTLMCRLVSTFRAEDRRERQGRRSWSPAEQVLERKPYLTAVVVHRTQEPRR